MQTGDSPGIDSTEQTRVNGGPIDHERLEIAENQELSEAELLRRGIAALQSGKETEARGLFLTATELYPDSLEPWLWKAKTSIDLAELISCLEKARALDPYNKKLMSDLALAVERHQADHLPSENITVDTHKVVTKHRFGWNGGVTARTGTNMAALSGLLLALLWLASGVVTILGPSLSVSDFDELRFVPLSTLPSLPFREMPFVRIIDKELVPVFDFNAIGLVPLGLALLLAVSVDMLTSRRPGAACWLLAVLTTQAACLFWLSPGAEAQYVVVILSCIAFVTAVLGPLLGK